jgi:hypothetical protein
VGGGFAFKYVNTAMDPDKVGWVNMPKINSVVGFIYHFSLRFASCSVAGVAVLPETRDGATTSKE